MNTNLILNRILNEARPGKQWDRWSPAVQAKKKKIDLEWLQWKYDERDNPQVSNWTKAADWKRVADLIKAIEKEDKEKIKTLVSALLRTPLQKFVGPHELNWSWEFAELDPRNTSLRRTDIRRR